MKQNHATYFSEFTSHLADFLINYDFLVFCLIHLFFLDTPTGTPLGSEEDLAPTPPLSNRTRSSFQQPADEAPRIQVDRSDLSRWRTNEMGNRGPPPDVTIPQGDSSSFGMNTRRSVHMSSVRAKRNEGSVLFIYKNCLLK